MARMSHKRRLRGPGGVGGSKPLEASAQALLCELLHRGEWQQLPAAPAGHPRSHSALVRRFFCCRQAAREAGLGGRRGCVWRLPQQRKRSCAEHEETLTLRGYRPLLKTRPPQRRLHRVAPGQPAGRSRGAGATGATRGQALTPSSAALPEATARREGLCRLPSPPGRAAAPSPACGSAPSGGDAARSSPGHGREPCAPGGGVLLPRGCSEASWCPELGSQLAEARHGPVPAEAAAAGPPPPRAESPVAARWSRPGFARCRSPGLGPPLRGLPRGGCRGRWRGSRRQGGGSAAP